jgi:hypothetical protein
MAYVQVDCSVARNRKLVKAGPAPSWLWLCGLCYCQEGQTDGFIPTEALPYLGVKNAKQLSFHLEQAGLWDVVPGGWQVHDYLEKNKSAEEIAELKAKRGSGGKLGGRPKKNLPQNPPETSKVSVSETFPVDVAVDGYGDVVVSGKGVQRETAPVYPMDEWWLQFVQGYPEARRRNSLRTNQLFVNALLAAKDGPAPAWARMRSNLTANVRSHEWVVKRMIPAMDRSLEEGRWENELPASAPVAEQLSAKTNRTIAAAAEILGSKAS